MVLVAGTGPKRAALILLDQIGVILTVCFGFSFQNRKSGFTASRLDPAGPPRLPGLRILLQPTEANRPPRLPGTVDSSRQQRESYFSSLSFYPPDLISSV